MRNQPSALRLKLSGYKRRYLQWRVVELQKRHQDYAFIHIPKCGGTSLIRAVGQLVKLHDTAQERRNKLGAARWNDLYTFSVTRHPYDRTVSFYGFTRETHYAKQRIGTMDLNEWIQSTLGDGQMSNLVGNRQLAPCKKWVSDEAGKIIVSDIFKLEEIDKDWKVIQNKTGCKGTLSRMNTSKSGLSRSDLDAKSRTIIQDHFVEDFEAFGYEI